MRILRFVCFVAAPIACLQSVSGQSFVNLDFENTTFTRFLVNSYTGYYATNATVPGWDWLPHQTFGNGDPNTTVAFNNLALSAAAVDLEGTNFFAPYSAIQGNYSIYLQGASYNGGGGALIGQTGQIPANAESITYWGGNFQVSFNGQLLSFNDISNALTYGVWQADISAYAGQIGELLFTCAERNGGMLDNIQFSSLPIPEPGIFGMFGLGALCFLRYRKNHS